MLDLAADEVRAYWVQTEPAIVGLLDRIERTEDWTLDDAPGMTQRLTALGEQISLPGSADRLAAADRESLLFFFAYLSTSRAFRLIRWLDEHHDLLGTRLLERLLTTDGQTLVAELIDPTLSGVMVQRLRVLQNTPYFTRLLAPSLLDSIERVIERYREEAPHEI